MTSLDDVVADRYRLVRLLGRGGMSDVYEAFDERSGTAVALKIVRSGDPEFARRLAQEARALESFAHPGLIRLLDTGQAGDQAYLVMELIDGPTLAASLRNGPLGSRETANLGARLAGALAYVHERGIVHRDVKPSNIMLTSNGDAWLGDFGIARHHDASILTVTGTTMGTVSYMAPEQLEDHQVGPAADIWSLGVVLLECLTARRVYEGTPSEVLVRRLAGPVPLPADLPVPWKLVLAGMLDHRPDQRPDGAQVAALLATPAFDAPWLPSDGEATTRLAAVGASGGTVIMPGIAAATADGDATTRLAEVGPSGRTVIMPGTAAATADGDETRIVKPPRQPATNKRRSRSRSRLASGVVALVALGIGLLFLLGSNTANPNTGPTTTSKATTTGPTTTVVLPGSAALVTLNNDLVTGQAAGSVDGASGQLISQAAGLAQADYVAGNIAQATGDLQQASSAIASGVESGVITQSEGAVLQGDLGLLASALNLGSAIAPTTTVLPPGNGDGHGNGHGNGH